MERITISWDTLKTIIYSYNLYYVDTDRKYIIILVNSDFINICFISKNINIIGKEDFEDNYKSEAIEKLSIDDCIAAGYNDL